VESPPFPPSSFSQLFFSLSCNAWTQLFLLFHTQGRSCGLPPTAACFFNLTFLFFLRLPRAIHLCLAGVVSFSGTDNEHYNVTPLSHVLFSSLIPKPGLTTIRGCRTILSSPCSHSCRFAGRQFSFVYHRKFPPRLPCHWKGDGRNLVVATSASLFLPPSSPSSLFATRPLFCFCSPRCTSLCLPSLPFPVFFSSAST